ncbi:MAG: 4Fe-4S dicluster domain-containing protein [Candidatus Rokubacteria bacterium]|nr:4Fe-4S dicluster domain-containing protein [Candidatus Rokubacteria bacterium]
MYIVAIDSSVCDGNAACVEGCPVTILSTEELEGKKKCVVSGATADCLGCMVCVEVCPTGAIKVTEI